MQKCTKKSEVKYALILTLKLCITFPLLLFYIFVYFLNLQLHFYKEMLLFPCRPSELYIVNIRAFFHHIQNTKFCLIKRNVFLFSFPNQNFNSFLKIKTAYWIAKAIYLPEVKVVLRSLYQ